MQFDLREVSTLNIKTLDRNNNLIDFFSFTAGYPLAKLSFFSFNIRFVEILLVDYTVPYNIELNFLGVSKTLVSLSSYVFYISFFRIEYYGDYLNFKLKITNEFYISSFRVEYYYDGYHYRPKIFFDEFFFDKRFQFFKSFNGYIQSIFNLPSIVSPNNYSNSLITNTIAKYGVNEIVKVKNFNQTFKVVFSFFSYSTNNQKELFYFLENEETFLISKEEFLNAI